MLSCLSEAHVAGTLSDLVWPHDLVRSSDFGRPRGFLDPTEPELCETNEFLPPDICDEVINWWLAVRKRARTPVWDIAATCTLPGFDQIGVVLIEAQAHSEELGEGGKEN